MKKTIAGMWVLAAVLLVAGCSKTHQCKCATTDVPDDGVLKIMTVGPSIGCGDIRQMAFEIHVVDSSTRSHSLERREVHEVECRNYGE